MERQAKLAFGLWFLVSVASGQPKLPSGDSIEVKFVVDGKTIPCSDLSLTLSIGNQEIVAVRTKDGFEVPQAILSEYADDSSRRRANVEAKIACGEHSVIATGLYPAQVLPGNWEVGIAHPTSWFDSPAGAPEIGTWVSYIVSECNGCDPGIVISQVHPDVAQTEIQHLRDEQRESSGERARDVAYALAVFDSDYRINRDRLVTTLSQCLARPVNSPEDDVCNGRLVQYLANLYWRGDNELLLVLIEMAQRLDAMVDQAGTFFADLLDRRTQIALNELGSVSEEKQRLVCAMALDNDLGMDPPKLERVTSNLRRVGTETGRRCLDALQRGVSN
jgi:hypothetical protein